MKVSFIIPSLATGGAEIQTIAQANEMSIRGINIQVIVLSKNDNLKISLNSNIHVVIFGARRFETLNKLTPLSAILSIRKLSRIINNFKPDHVIAMLPQSFLMVRLLTSLKLISSKIWIYHHSTEYFETPLINIYRRIYKILLVDFISSKKESHIFISKAVREDISQNEDISKGVILGNAVKLPSIETIEKNFLLEKYNLSNERYILFPGTFSKRKGHLFFLKSIHDLIKKYNITLVIAGYGPLKKEINDCVNEFKLQDNVIFTGKLENKELVELISSAYFSVIPSIVEGFGNVAIESMAVGTTVLCSDAGGLPEVIKDGETGYIFQKENTKDLREKFEKLILNKELLIDPKVLKKEYREKFTVKAQIDNLIKILDEKD